MGYGADFYDLTDDDDYRDMAAAGNKAEKQVHHVSKYA